MTIGRIAKSERKKTSWPGGTLSVPLSRLDISRNTATAASFNPIAAGAFVGACEGEACEDKESNQSAGISLSLSSASSWPKPVSGYSAHWLADVAEVQ